jgi:hypothetical protein
LLKDKWQRILSSPFFAIVLEKWSFIVFYSGGLLVCCSSIYFNWTIGNEGLFVSYIFATIIFGIICPAAYFFAKSILAEFNRLFESGSKYEEVAFLFIEDKDLSKYSTKICQCLHSRYEKVFAIGLGFILWLPVNLVQDIASGYLTAITEAIGPLAYIGYSFYVFYWSFAIAVIFSVAWMVLTVTKGLLDLKKESEKLNIKQSIAKLRESIESKELQKLPKDKFGLLEPCFSTFKSGLGAVVSLVVSMAVKIAVVSLAYSIPSVIYFATTNQIFPTWYAAATFGISLSIAVFVIGQYGAWRLWSSSKKETVKLLTQACKIRTTLKPSGPRYVRNDINYLNGLITEINRLPNVTYTSSAVLKIAAANFLAFGPVLLKEILTATVFK